MKYVHYERPIYGWRPEKDRFTTKWHSVPARRHQREARLFPRRSRTAAWAADWAIEEGGAPPHPLVPVRSTPGNTM